MRILIVASALGLEGGGGEMYASLLAEQLSLRHEVTLLACRKGEDREGNPALKVISPPQVSSLARLSRRSFLIKALWHYLEIYNPLAVRSLKNFLSRLRPDVIHTHRIDGFSHALFRVAGRLGIPVIHTLHSCAELCPYAVFTCPYRRWLPCPRPPAPCMAYLLGNRAATSGEPSTIIGPSRFILDMHERYGYLRDKDTHHIPNPVALPAVNADHAPTADPDSAVYLGALAVHKGIHVLLKAWPEVRKRFPGASLHIAGDGPLRPQVVEAAEKDASISYYGRLEREAVAPFLRRSSLLIFPSLCLENQPLTILEAAACGLPAVTTTLGGLPELVEDGVTGLLVQPGDIQALSRAAARLLEDAPFREKVAGEASRRAAQVTMESHLSRLEKIYGETANEG